MPSAYFIEQSEMLEATRLVVASEAGVVTARTHWDGGPGVGTLSLHSQHLPGIELMEISGELHQPLAVDSNDGIPWVGMLYQQAGGIASTLRRGQSPALVSAGQHNARFERSEHHRHTLYPQQGRYRCFNIQIEPDYFIDLVEQQPEWRQFYQGRQTQDGAFMLLPHGAAPTPAVALALSQLRSCPYAGTLKKLFLEARFLDLLIAQHQQYISPQLAGTGRRDRDVFHAIRDFLDSNYADELSLLGLARQFGINDCKLKQGFKAMFGTTVFGYLADKRLSTARALLEASTLPVQEVGEAVGFGNPAHFATAFRRKFGQAPSQLRRQG